MHRVWTLWALSAVLLSVCGTGCGRSDLEGKTTLVMSYGKMSPEHAETLSQLVQQFEKNNPGIAVVLHPLAPVTDQQRHFYLQSFTARSSFIDVFELDVIWTAELAAAGVLEPVGDNIGKPVLTDLHPASLAAATYSGTLVAIPAYPAVSMLYYRTDLLEKYKLQPPTSLEEMAEQAIRIRGDEKIRGFVWQADMYEGLVCNFLEYYRGMGGVVQITEKGVALDADSAVAALEFMKKLVADGASSEDVFGYRELESREVFLSGNAVFTRDWDDLAAYVADSEVNGKVGFMPLPPLAGNPTAPTLGGWHYGVNHASLYKAEAWKLVSFLSLPENQQKLARKLGRFPARNSVAIPAFEGVQGTGHRRELLSAGVPRPASPYYHQLSMILQEHLGSALTGLETPVNAVKAANEKLKEIKLPETAGPDFPKTLLNPSTVY